MKNLFAICFLVLLSNSSAFYDWDENRAITDWQDFDLDPNDFYDLIKINKKSFQNLTEPIFENFQIYELDLVDNFIENINNLTFSKIIGLKILRIGQNRISSFHDIVAGQYGLELVSVFSNKITQMIWNGLNECIYPNMTNIDLKMNGMSFIMDNAFVSFCNLNFLNLDFNKITFISKNTFSNLTKLVSLFMRNNLLKTIESKAFFDLTSLCKNFVFFW